MSKKHLHNTITSTVICTHLVNSESDSILQIEQKTDEAEELLKAGFDYFTDMDEYKILRKCK
jgi:hypothetical protein